MEDEETCERQDGLADKYDLVLLGTGLVQAILSCVAAKHGIKVLHLESAEHYGEDYSCHHLSTHLLNCGRLTSVQNVGLDTLHFPLSEGVPIHELRLLQCPTVQTIAQFVDKISSVKGFAKPKGQLRSGVVHPACFGYAMEHDEGAIDTTIHPTFMGYVPHRRLTKARVWHRDRDFNIDTTTKVLYGSCPLVDLMVASGVANYLEFKSFEGLYFWMDGASGNDCNGQVWKVPCSRVEVFNTTMLGALEKRALMKFHQFVADWGRTNSGTDVVSLNETDLAVGRSLYRPQNKQQSFAGFNVETFIDRPFEDFLDDCKMSAKLKRIIIFALCCYTSPPKSSARSAGQRLAPDYLTRQALCDMFAHIDSIGRFGETAFLSPMYGSSEVVQAFCRMSAVWGGTFILRRSVSALGLESTEVGLSGSREAPAPAPAASVTSVLDSEGNVLRCGAFVCSAGYYPGVPLRSSAIVSCTSTWLGSIVPLARSIIIIPPLSLAAVRNAYPVHIFQTDSSTCASPEGTVVLHVSTMIDIEGNSTASAGHTLSWQDLADACSPRAVELVDAIMNSLVDSMQPGAPHCAELSRVWWTVCVDAAAQYAPMFGWLSMQAACDEARDIFAQLFPSKDFTLQDISPPASDDSQQIPCTNSVENDDEAAFLEFALSSAQPISGVGL